jgi:large subunit ribosomal protein L31
MKKDIHPEYREVVFQDAEADYKILTRSTIKTKDKITLDGKEYPLVKLEISSASHPYFTGTEKFVDTAGRVERFQKKFGGAYFDKPEKKKKPAGRL